MCNYIKLYFILTNIYIINKLNITTYTINIYISVTIEII